jgi:TolB-like protein/Flp pilus assembly protein TadD
MADESKAKLRLEIAHVLFMDIVDYSKLLTDEQSEALHELNQIVRNTEAAREAEAARQLTILPTGDGMALVFTGSVEEPVECALEISQALRAQPSLPVRMGIHSGPVHHVKDANQRENIAGVGINIAQRVMDCGDAGHILVSKRVADDLAQQRRWHPYLHELGDVEVKHGVVISLVNLYAETIGNPNPPTRIGKMRGRIRGPRAGTRKGLSPLARAIFIIFGLLVALTFALAIVSVIFAPAIMRTLDKRGLATSPQSSATASPSLADTIKSAVAKKITEELQADLSGRKTGEAKPSATGSAIPEKSIAVLPFENLSRDPDNAYFADGIQEEILTRLAKIADLKVISHTSTQQFQSSPDNLPEIAKQLRVANILEGSVQKAGDQVRVNVQLINAASEAHLWAESYDRKLTDAFAIESEIAKTVADTLQAKLTGSEKRAISARPTENPAAYQDYLKGRYFWNKRTSDDFKTAISYFEQAVDKDPAFALAYVGLADTYVLLPAFTWAAPEDTMPKAKVAAQKALELDDKLAEAHTSLAMVLRAYDFDYNRAVTEFQRALELNPNYAPAHYWFGTHVLSALGRFDEAVTEVKRALELDPLSLVANVDLGTTYVYARRFDDAIDQLRKAIELDTNFYYAHYELGIALKCKGQIDAAIAELEKAHQLNDDPIVPGLLGQAYAAGGRRDDALKILAQLKNESARRYVPAYTFAVIYLGLGDKEEALRWLEKDFSDRDGWNIGFIKVDPMLDPLRGDPRFEALAQKVFAPKKAEADSGQSLP